MGEFNALIKTEYDDKESPYLREVVERDLVARRTEAADIPPDALVKLARDVFGKMGARQMTKATEGLDQAEELAEMLRRYIAEHSEKQKPSHSRIHK